MPRRYPDYADAYAGWNWVSSIGSMISVVATALFLYVVYDALVQARPAANAPWSVPGYYTDSQLYQTGPVHSSTLEWALPSPTPMHAYASLPLQS